MSPGALVDLWSEPTRGISGRLRVEFEDLEPGLRHAVWVELRNHSLDPVALTNQPEVHAELLDASGQPVSTSDFSVSGPIPHPQWAVIPRDAYVGFRIDAQTLGVPTREHGMALLAVGGKAWRLRTRRYALKVALVFKNEKNAPKNQWAGQLDLPSVEVVVTAEMLAVK